MKRTGFFAALMASIIFPLMTSAAQTNQLPKFDEIYELVRSHPGNLSETELNRAAVRGLLNQLKGRVLLVGDASKGSMPGLDSLSKISVLEKSFGYFRVGKIDSGLSESLKSSYEKMVSTNKIKGVVLDLRYSGGTDYAAAVKAADLFLKSDQQLLHLGETSIRGTSKTNAITVPVAVLVNRETSGAAEALAGMLREEQTGLIIGTNTAGQASVFKDFTLSDGQILKIASTPVKLGNGKEISDEGLKPDIEVAVSAEDEKAYYENPYRQSTRLFSKTDANGSTVTASTETRRPRLNEAELVRLQREGLTPEQEFLPTDVSSKTTAARVPDDDKRLLSDPVLVRALDILKGLAVVERSR